MYTVQVNAIDINNRVRASAIFRPGYQVVCGIRRKGWRIISVEKADFGSKGELDAFWFVLPQGNDGITDADYKDIKWQELP